MPGIPDLFTSLPTFSDAFFFFGNELHMLGHGMGHLIYNLIDPETNDFYKAVGISTYSFDVDSVYSPREFMSKVGEWNNASKVTCPTAFDYSFDKRKGYYRAVDWQQFLLYIVPTIIVPRLLHAETQKALMKLVYAVSISLQKFISERDLTAMKK